MNDLISTKTQVGPWIIESLWGDAPFPVEMHITPSDPESVGSGISSTILRDIKLTPPLRTHETPAEKRATAAMNRASEFEVGGRGTMTADYLSALSEAYVAVTKTGTDSPVKVLASHLGKNAGTIKNHLIKARKEGLLSD
ncbi:hypothetical protein ACIP4V_02605 [Streptomyces albidoflavus]